MNNRKVINNSCYNAFPSFSLLAQRKEAKRKGVCGGGKKSFPSRRPAGGTTQSASLCIVLSPQPCYGRRIFSFTPHVSEMTLTTREIQRFQQWQDATVSSEVPPCNLLFSFLCFVSFFFSGRRKKERNEGKNFYYHMNHLGSTAFVTDQNQNVTQGFLYAPFGEITTEYNANFGNNVLPKYSFNAKELDEETGMYYYEARYYKPPVFTSRDPMMEQKPWLTPYHYCSNNPVGRVDISGNWDIEVHAYHDRKKSGYAVLIVKDRNGKEVYRTVVNTIGEGGRKRNVQYADTPQGKYKILEYRKTGDGTRYNRESYGPNDLLALNYEGEEGKGRNKMHLHGGRQEGKNKGRKNLANTRGCMRINDQDILEIQNITNDLEKNDSKETKGYLILTDDLKSPVDYSPNSSYRHKVAADQFPLPVPPLDLQIDPSLLKRMIVPIDNTRVALPNILMNYE